MAYATNTRATGSSTGSGFGQRFTAFRAAMADRYARNRVYRTTVTELSALTDRELADLGINRSMIGSIAADAAHGVK